MACESCYTLPDTSSHTIMKVQMGILSAGDAEALCPIKGSAVCK